MKTLTFKVSDAEARAIQEKARRERLSVSEFLRRRARQPSPEPIRPTLRRCPVTGALVFAAAANQTPLTVAATRELLADFP